jgi:U2 small nuclear ribonucleoprotein B''
MEGKPGLAFVEFHNEFQATRAMESLQGFKVTPAHAMQISYAKK